MSNARTISCPHYEAVPGSRRCRSYVDGGTCSRPDMFVCEEWVRANPRARPGSHAPETNREVLPDAKAIATSRDTSAVLSGPGAGTSSTTDAPGETRSLLGDVVTSAPARTPRAAPRRSLPMVPAHPSTHERFLGPVTDEHLAALEQLGIEVCVRSEVVNELWLVPVYTGAVRNEMTFRDAATLATLCAAFPGAEISSFRRTRATTSRIDT